MAIGTWFKHLEPKTCVKTAKEVHGADDTRTLHQDQSIGPEMTRNAFIKKCRMQYTLYSMRSV